MELITSRLTLREFRDDDLVSFRELETHPLTHHYESAHPDDSVIRTYLESAQSDVLQNPRVRYRFAMTIQPEDKIRGRVTLSLINTSIR